MNHVFLSYRHESSMHAASVRELGERLRAAGIPVALDQFFVDDNPGGPNKGWRHWCENYAERSACVLIVCSKGWFDSYWQEGPADQGLGAALEAAVFAQDIYDRKGKNARVRLVVLDDFEEAAIPARLRAWQIFRPFADAAQFDQMTKWIRQRLASPPSDCGAHKAVFLAECTSDMGKERKKLQAFLEEGGWQVRPSPAYPAAGRQEALEADLKDSVAFVQLLESFPRENGFDREQDRVARSLGKKCFVFRDDRIAIGDAEGEHLEFLSRKDIILGSFDDFKQHLRLELEKLWHQQKLAPANPGGLRRALVRVVVRSPNRESLWDKVFDWIDQQPDIRSHLLEESEHLTDKADPSAPCHGYLIVCDGAAYEAGAYSPRRDMEDCSLIQQKEKDESRLPPAGLVYWPPPAPSWSRLQQVTPIRLHRILGDDPAKLGEFFEDVRRAYR